MDLAKFIDMLEGHSKFGPNALKEFSRDELIELIDLLEEDDRREDYSGHLKWFKDEGAYSIHNLPKHNAFFNATKVYRENLLLGGNRSGKSIAGAFLLAVVATGRYPSWWQGVSWDRPVKCWAVGLTAASTRDIIQDILLGSRPNWGTGMIPKDCIGEMKPGDVPGAISMVKVKHVSGGWSEIGFKSYNQPVLTFAGTARDVIWLDEPCPDAHYQECLIRTARLPDDDRYPANDPRRGGKILHTITPKDGLTKLLADYLADCDLLAGTESLAGLDVARALMAQEAKDRGEEVEDAPKKDPNKKQHRAAISIGWDDVPWMDQKTKDELLASHPPHLHDTISRGVPSIGFGAVYPIPLESVLLKPEDCPQIPAFWRRWYAMDVGKTTAAVFFAHDPDNDVIYVTGEHYLKDQPKELHAAAIRRVAFDWMPGLIDPASGQTSQTDMSRLITEYRRLGLKLQYAENTLMAGLHEVHSRLAQGKLKFFAHTTKNLQNEYILYRWDDNPYNPKPIKTNDHALDALRYGVMGARFGKPQQVTSNIVLGSRPSPQGKRYNV